MFQLEPTRPGNWSSIPPEEWQRQRGNLIRLAITPAHREHGTWHLGGIINIAAGTASSTLISRSGSRDLPPGEPTTDPAIPPPD